MLDTSQLQLALQEMSEGAFALLHAGRASDVAPTIKLSAAFTRRAVSEPLTRLALLLGEEPRPRRVPRPRKTRKVLRPLIRELAPGQLPMQADFDDFEQVSAWDPDERPVERPYSPDSDPLLESGSCRALLLEIVRRASYDWVLYRTSSKLVKRMLAENAHHWLFVEDEGTPAWAQREQTGKELTSFVAICEAVGVDPDSVRKRIRLLTERDIMGAGRPAERRKHKSSNDDVLQSDDLAVFDVDVASLPVHDFMFPSADS